MPVLVLGVELELDRATLLSPSDSSLDGESEWLAERET